MEEFLIRSQRHRNYIVSNPPNIQINLPETDSFAHNIQSLPIFNMAHQHKSSSSSSSSRYVYVNDSEYSSPSSSSSKQKKKGALKGGSDLRWICVSQRPGKRGNTSCDNTCLHNSSRTALAPTILGDTTLPVPFAFTSARTDPKLSTPNEVASFHVTSMSYPVCSLGGVWLT